MSGASSLTADDTAANSKAVMAGLTSYEVNGYIVSGDTNAMCYFVGGCVATNGDTADGMQIYTRLSTISDGTSNTLMFMERYAYNCVYNPGVYGNRTWGDTGGASMWSPMLIHAGVFEVAPVPGKHSCYVGQAYTGEGCQISFADGTVRQIHPGISGTVWWHLCLPNDGFTVALPD